MCGRYAITTAPEAMRALFRYPDQPNFPPRYNVAPTQPIAIVRLWRDQAEWKPVSRPDQATNDNLEAPSADESTRSAQAGLLPAKPESTFADRAREGQRRFALVRWGLIPSWVKDPRAFSLLINARGESVLDKPAFRSAMRYRRCLIPADGFYEWRRDGDRKRPYYVQRKGGGLLAFAGLWEAWSGPNGEEIETAAIVTTAANRTLQSIHDRMPVIVPSEAFDLWLDCGNVDAQTAATLIAPAPDDLLEAHEVSSAVNRTANDSAALIEPLSGSDVAAAATPKPKPEKRAKAKSSDDEGQASLF